MAEPLVSVVLVSYNEETYIKQALDGILKQKTNFKFEIICHDDASTDSTQSIISIYKEKYHDIIVPILQNKNRMQAGHQIIVEYCYPVAKGKYIAYCDGDDYWTDETKLQKQVDFLENNPEYSLCFHNFEYLYEDNKTVKPSDCGNFDRDFVVDEFIKWDSRFIPQLGTSLFRAELAMNRPEVFVKIGGGKKSKRPISDQPLYIYLAMKGKVRYFSEVMSIWRRHGNTWTNDGNIDKEIQFLNDKKVFLDTIGKNYPELNEESILFAKRNCDYFIGWISEDYSLAWANIRFVKVRTLTKFFIYFARIFPNFARSIRKNHK